MKSRSTLKVVLNAAKVKPEGVVGSGKAGIAFGERFVAGEIPTFHCMLEDSAALQDLQDVDPPGQNQVMNIPLVPYEQSVRIHGRCAHRTGNWIAPRRCSRPNRCTAATCVSNKRLWAGWTRWRLS